jgi:antitoxin component YwqK of YwqJK toxin-antitoxin module
MNLKSILVVSIVFVCQHFCCCQIYNNIEGIKKDTIYPFSFPKDTFTLIKVSYILDKDYTFNECYLMNGNRIREYYLLNDEITGTYKEWYEGGQLKMIYNAINGARVGPFLQWYTNGQLKEFKFYPYDENLNVENKIDTIVEVADNGIDVKVLFITHKGKLENGIAKGYHENGQLSYLGNYLNGNKHGKWEYWDKKGTLMRVEKFVQGQWIEMILYEGEKETIRNNEFERIDK